MRCARKYNISCFADMPAEEVAVHLAIFDMVAKQQRSAESQSEKASSTQKRDQGRRGGGRFASTELV